MRRAAVVLVVRDNGTVLAVSRPDPPLRYAFPGGGVEPGESFEQAARRELREETGIIADRLVPLFTEQRGRTLVAMFVETGHPRGVTRSSHEGWARWVDPRVVACAGGAWPEFARKTFVAAGLRAPIC